MTAGDARPGCRRASAEVLLPCIGGKDRWGVLSAPLCVRKTSLGCSDGQSNPHWPMHWPVLHAHSAATLRPLALALSQVGVGIPGAVSGRAAAGRHAREADRPPRAHALPLRGLACTLVGQSGNMPRQSCCASALLAIRRCALYQLTHRSGPPPHVAECDRRAAAPEPPLCARGRKSSRACVRATVTVCATARHPRTRSSQRRRRRRATAQDASWSWRREHGRGLAARGYPVAWKGCGLASLGAVGVIPGSR